MLRSSSSIGGEAPAPPKLELLLPEEAAAAGGWRLIVTFISAGFRRLAARFIAGTPGADRFAIVDFDQITARLIPAPVRIAAEIRYCCRRNYNQMS